jgi:hypothetical protein
MTENLRRGWVKLFQVYCSCIYLCTQYTLSICRSSGVSSCMYVPFWSNFSQISYLKQIFSIYKSRLSKLNLFQVLYIVRQKIFYKLTLHAPDSSFFCPFHTVPSQSTYIPRVPQWLSSRPNWDSPTPSPARECTPPPPGTKRRGTRSPVCEGLGESNSTTGEKA